MHYISRIGAKNVGVTGLELRVWVGWPRPLVAERTQSHSILDVIGFVEDQFSRIAEVDEPQGCGQEHD